VVSVELGTQKAQGAMLELFDGSFAAPDDHRDIPNVTTRNDSQQQNLPLKSRQRSDEGGDLRGQFPVQDDVFRARAARKVLFARGLDLARDSWPVPFADVVDRFVVGQGEQEPSECVAVAVEVPDSGERGQEHVAGDVVRTGHPAVADVSRDLRSQQLP
jgi:hypothetical protein